MVFVRPGAIYGSGIRLDKRPTRIRHGRRQGRKGLVELLNKEDQGPEGQCPEGQGPDDQKTLADCKFVIGDFLDIAITPPTGRMDRYDLKIIRI